MAIHVRPVVETDLALLRKEQARPELGLVDLHFAAQSTGSLIFAVAFDAESPLGTAVLDFESEEITPELRNMYVFPGARRRGAGRALSTYLENEARLYGFTAVYLAVDPNNVRAIPLYVSLEYHPTGEHLFVEEPEITQVEDGMEASRHYAVYKKSLTLR